MCVFNYACISHICSCDLHVDFDLMTLIYELDLNIVKCVLSTKIEFLDQGFQKLMPEQDRQTHRQTRPNALPSVFAGSKNNYSRITSSPWAVKLSWLQHAYSRFSGRF